MARHTQKLRIDEKDREWLAGVFDARATCEVARMGGKLQPRIRFNAAMPGVARAIAEACHLSTTLRQWTHPDGKRPTYTLSIAGENAVEMCRLLLPYLRTTKRQEAELLAQYPLWTGPSVPSEMTTRRQEIRDALWSLHGRHHKGAA